MPVNVRRHVRRKNQPSIRPLSTPGSLGTNTVIVKRWRYPRGPYRKIRFVQFRTEKDAKNFIRREQNAARNGGDYASTFVLLHERKYP